MKKKIADFIAITLKKKILEKSTFFCILKYSMHFFSLKKIRMDF